MIKKGKIVPVLALIWAIIIFIVSGIPGDSIKLPPLWNIDKFLHMGVYFVLALLMYFSLTFSKKSRSHLRIFIITLLWVVVYGGVLEIMQQHVFIGRFGDILDFTANSIGALLGSVIPYIVLKRKVVK